MITPLCAAAHLLTPRRGAADRREGYEQSER
jgi:hypothetical protein